MEIKNKNELNYLIKKTNLKSVELLTEPWDILPKTYLYFQFNKLVMPNL